MNKQILGFIFVSLGLFSGSQAHAGSLNLGYSTDSANINSQYIDLSFDLSKQTQLYFGGGSSTIEDSAGEIKTTSLNLGLSGIASDDFDYDMGYSFWGNKNEISSTTGYFSLAYYAEDWKLTLRPELQKILLYTRNNRRQVDISGTGIYGGVEYFGFNNIELLFAHTSYSYNRNLALLNTRLADLFFSNTTLLLGSSFLETKNSAEITFVPSTINWLPERISLGYAQSVNAIDKSISETLTATISLNLTKQLALQLETGEVRPENRNKLTFVAANLTYYF